MENELLNQTVSFFKQQKIDYPSHLALKYPRILNKIYSLWNNKVECVNYLESLLVNDRSEQRQGFSFEVLCEINNIKQYFENVKNIKFDPWEDPKYFHENKTDKN